MAYKIIAGDYEGCLLDSVFSQVFIIVSKGTTLNLDKSNIESVVQVTEENKKNFVGAAGWALAGSVLLGPLGVVAGALFGGNKKEITFACYLKNGKKIMVVTDVKTYQKLLAYSF